MRIVNPGNLVSTGEEVLLDKHVMLREKNAKAGVRMIPADNFVIREFAVFDFVNVLPRVLGKSNVSAALCCVDSGDTCLNGGPVIFGGADQHTADLGFHGRAGVLANFASNLRFND